MASEHQIRRIERLLDDLGWDRGQLAFYDPAWERYEELDEAQARELIRFLAEEKRIRNRVE